MSACKEHEGMGRDEFASHIKGLAKKIKNTVAELAAETVSDDAATYKWRVKAELLKKDAAENGGTTSGNYPMPKDKGLSLLTASEQKEVAAYKSNYEIDILDFDDTDVEEVERQLKEEHLTWIVDKFGRGGELPDPEKSAAPISKLKDMVGDSGVLEIEEDKDGEVSVSVGKESALVDVATANAAGLSATVDSWTAGAGDMFRDQFLPRIPIAGANQINALKAMRNLLSAHQGLLGKAREDVDGIAHDGLAAVESFDSCCDGGDADITTYLGVTAGVACIVAGVAGLAAGGGGAPLIVAGATILSGTATTAQSLEGAKGDTSYTLGAEDLEGVVDNISAALDKTYGSLDDGYDAIKDDGMTGLMDRMAYPEWNKNILAPRPGSGDNGVNFTDATQGNVVETVEG